MTPDDMSLSCPVPISRHKTVQLAHGGGGTLMHRLLDETILPAFKHDLAEQQHDSAVLSLGGQRLAFTTDSFVVHPAFFPGGNIGTLAVHGTVNDLAMAGAKPVALSAGLILEEGFPIEDLERVIAAMDAAIKESPAALVTGDTKVVDKGKGDGVFINTAGIGVIEHDRKIHPGAVQPGDAILVSGDLGRHGMAIMALREGLEFETTIESDTACLWPLVEALLEADIDIHCLRDITRGGLASSLIEIAGSVGRDIRLDAKAVPVCNEVRGACEMLGLDPFYVANEGRMVLFVPEAQADQALALLQGFEIGGEAARVGAVSETGEGLVTLKSDIGAERILDMLSGEQLPRIC